jgi:hypothetical protein
MKLNVVVSGAEKENSKTVYNSALQGVLAST